MTTDVEAKKRLIERAWQLYRRIRSAQLRLDSIGAAVLSSGMLNPAFGVGVNNTFDADTIGFTGQCVLFPGWTGLGWNSDPIRTTDSRSVRIVPGDVYITDEDYFEIISDDPSGTYSIRLLRPGRYASIFIASCLVDSGAGNDIHNIGLCMRAGTNGGDYGSSVVKVQSCSCEDSLFCAADGPSSDDPDYWEFQYDDKCSVFGMGMVDRDADLQGTDNDLWWVAYGEGKRNSVDVSAQILVYRLR